MILKEKKEKNNPGRQERRNGSCPDNLQQECVFRTRPYSYFNKIQECPRPRAKKCSRQLRGAARRGDRLKLQGALCRLSGAGLLSGGDGLAGSSAASLLISL